MKRFSACLCLIAGLFASSLKGAVTLSNGVYNVFPGDNIQEALELAAQDKTNKTVKVHAGEYRPNSKRQAMIWFNKKHDGIRLEADGTITLTAANPDLGASTDPGYPAVVNHVVYFGDGISSNTVLKGFRITGANNFVTKEGTKELEPNSAIRRNWFFFSDGGAIKIFGHSSPTLENLEIADNFTSPCGAGISIQQQGLNQDAVSIKNCVFLRNKAQATGSALDLLAGSSARLVNCLFVGNVSNMGDDPVAKASGERPFVNSGVVTIFQNSRAEFRNCTFTGNRNGIDDMGGQSSYLNCIFFENKLEGGKKAPARYDLAVNGGAKKISGCFFNGTIHDVTHVISSSENVMNAPDPKFDKNFVPQTSEYKDAGYRPINEAR
jgi:hypothetical protein